MPLSQKMHSITTNMSFRPFVHHARRITETHAQPKLDALHYQSWHIHSAIFYFLIGTQVILCCALLYYIFNRVCCNNYRCCLYASRSGCREDFQSAHEMETGLGAFQNIEDPFSLSSSMTDEGDWLQHTPTSSTASDLGLSRYFHKNGHMRFWQASPCLKWELDLRKHVEHGNGPESFLDRLVNKGVGWTIWKLNESHGSDDGACDWNSEPTMSQSRPMKQFVLGDIQKSRLAQRRRAAS